MPTPVLGVRSLKKTYGDLVAVDCISFSVARGEVFGILGPNGAGKTTTLECIETLRPFDGGEVELDGIDVRTNPQEVKRRIGVQLQSSSFFDRLSLRELLSAGAQTASRIVRFAADAVARRANGLSQLASRVAVGRRHVR